MKTQLSTILCSVTLAGVLIASAGSSLAQQKTVKQCDAEWQANKAAVQASGKTKKDYVAACRQGVGNAAAPPSGRTATPAAKSQLPVTASPRTAGKSAEQAPATRTRPSANATATTTQTSPKASATPKSQPAGRAWLRPNTTAEQTPATRARPGAGAGARTETARASPRATGNAAAAQFSTLLAAKAHCPADTVVWANTDSKIYHYSDSARYGKTKDGAYMCEKDTAAAGFRAAKNEKRP